MVKLVLNDTRVIASQSALSQEPIRPALVADFHDSKAGDMRNMALGRQAALGGCDEIATVTHQDRIDHRHECVANATNDHALQLADLRGGQTLAIHDLSAIDQTQNQGLNIVFGENNSGGSVEQLPVYIELKRRAFWFKHAFALWIVAKLGTKLDVRSAGASRTTHDAMHYCRMRQVFLQA